MQMTTTELAEKLRVDYPTANAIVKIGTQQGTIKEIGKKINPSGRGKGSTIYEFPKTLTIKIED